MSDNTELKRAAEGAVNAGDHWGRRDSFERQLAKLATPEAVLALIAENERLKSLFDQSEKCIDRINALHQEAWVKKLGVSYPNYGGFPDNLEKLSIERDQLKAENEALRKDAGRYRWLRDSSESIHQFYLSTPIWFTSVKFSKENVDSTIDAAMGKGEKS